MADVRLHRLRPQYGHLGLRYPRGRPGLTDKALASAVGAIDRSGIEPYTDTFANRPLIENPPVPGKIVSTAEGPFSSQLLTLSNGIKVYLRPSTTKPDQVIVHGFSPGGFSMSYSPERKPVYTFMENALQVCGFVGHSAVDLRKLLAGHNVKSTVKIGNMDEEIAVETTSADLDAAMQVLYLKASGMTRDDTALGALLAAERARLAKPDRSATFAMGDSIHSVVFRHHPLGEKLTLADLDKVDFDSLVSLYNERFGDMSDFTFVITGNFDTDSVRPLVERYIASLPANGRRETPRDIGYGYAGGDSRHDYTHPMPQSPQSIAYSFYNAECDYNLPNVLTAHALSSVFKTRLLNELREKRALSYGITTHCGISNGFNGPGTPARVIMPVYVKVKPGHEQEVFDVVRATIADLAKNGPTAEELAKVTAFMRKDILESRDDNGYWDTVLKVNALYGRDMDSGYSGIVDAMTHAAVAAFAARYLTLPAASRTEMTMTPEK